MNDSSQKKLSPISQTQRDVLRAQSSIQILIKSAMYIQFLTNMIFLRRVLVKLVIPVKISKGKPYNRVSLTEESSPQFHSQISIVMLDPDVVEPANLVYTKENES